MSFQKNVKSHVFSKSEKNVKYVFSNPGGFSATAELLELLVSSGSVRLKT